MGRSIYEWWLGRVSIRLVALALMGIAAAAMWAFNWLGRISEELYRRGGGATPPRPAGTRPGDRARRGDTDSRS